MSAVGAALAATALIVSAGAWFGVSPASAASMDARASVPTARLAASHSSLAVSVAPQNAGLLAPGQDLIVTVTVSNTGTTAADSGTIEVWMRTSPLATRSDLSTWLGSASTQFSATTLGHASVGVVEPGSKSQVTVTVPAATLPQQSRVASAVFGIGTTVSFGADTRAEGRSALVWNAAPAGDKSGVAVALPIASPPTGNGILSATDLATFTAPNGVLTRDLDGLAGHPTVAVGIDPMIIASIRALGSAAPPTALAWLIQLSQLPNATFSLGYGDADVAAQVQSGITTPLAPTSLAFALDPQNFTSPPIPVGEPRTTSAPGIPAPSPTASAGPVLPTLAELTAWPFTLHGITWPSDGVVRSGDLPTFVAAGLTTTIVSGSNTTASDLKTTPNAAIAAAGETVAAADKDLSNALRSAATATSDVAWNDAMSRVNTGLALASEESTTGRQLLVTLGRSAPSSGTQLARTLSAVLASPWSTPSTLEQAIAGPATPGLAIKDGSAGDARIRNIKLLQSNEDAIGQFATILDDPTALTGPARTQVLSLLAVSWQSSRDWSAAVAASSQASLRTLESVKVSPTETVNLVSTQGSIPFSVSNSLTDQAANIVLVASPSNSRLEIDGPTSKRIQADSRTTVLVPVKAKVGNGQVQLRLQLYSKTGHPIGFPTTVTVDVHADWEGIGAMIVGALVVLLFGFGIVRNILRRRRELRTGSEADAAPADAAPANAAPADAEEPRG